MLSEAELIVIGVLIAAGLVVLGVLELVWPTRPRHPTRRSEGAPDPWRRALERSAVPTWPIMIPDDPVDATAAGVVETSLSPHGSLVVEDSTLAPSDVSLPAVAGVTPSAPVPAPSRSEREVRAVELCFTLFEAKRFAEVVASGEEALKAQVATAASALTPAAAERMARLWGVVGLAKQELEDPEGARFAFEEAIALAPGTERSTWEQHLATLALAVGRQALSGVTAAGLPPPDRVDTLRSAIEWLERGLAVAPDDAPIHEALAAAHDALWSAYDAEVKALMQQLEFTQARRVLGEAMADPDCPPARQSAFRSLLTKTMSGEVGQATAEAIRHVEGGREDEAVAALARADSVMAGIAGVLPPKTRQELERRRWRAYMKLGTHRMEAGVVQAALDPLLRALSVTAVQTKSHNQTRAVLARALGVIVDAQSAEILRLIDAGEAGAAAAQSNKLWSLLRGAVDQGLPEDDLSDASENVLALFDRLGAKRP